MAFKKGDRVVCLSESIVRLLGLGENYNLSLAPGVKMEGDG